MQNEDTVALYRWRFDGGEFDEAAMSLVVKGEPQALEPKPARLLGVLLRHAGEVVTKPELFDSVWEGRPTVDHVLATAIGKLRKVLGEVSGIRIDTLPRVGYRLSGQVERVVSRQRAASMLNLAPGQAVALREHFLLERQLDATGASEVWLACNRRTGESRVYKFALDGDRLAGLKREATLNRLLRQSMGEASDVVRIIDWNFSEPPFYLECEFAGDRLDAWAAQNDRLAGMARSARLELLLRIARCVAAAHDAGVLHKDIKPANILVSDEGEGWRPRLTDFGSAALLDPDALERLGITAMGMTVAEGLASSSQAGTLMYLAPEVLAGESASARSDVFALGILLYQMLVGDFRRLLSTGWEQEIDDPLLEADIRAATEGQPQRRLATVQSLVERLERLADRRSDLTRQAHDAREAKRARATLARSRARRPWVLATLTALALVLGVSLWSSWQMAAARDRAAQSAAEAEAINRFLLDLLDQGDRNRSLAGRDLTIREALERSGELIGERFAHRPDVELSVQVAVAGILASLGETELMRHHAARAEALLARPGAPRMLPLRYELAQHYSASSDFEPARRVLEAADALAGERLLRDPSTRFLSDRAWGRFHLLQVQADEAVVRIERAIEHLLRYRPDDLHELHAQQTMLSQALVRTGDFARAIDVLEGLRESRFLDAGVPRTNRAMVEIRLAESLSFAGLFERADALYPEALAMLAESYGEDSLQYGLALGSQANFFAMQGRFDEALEPGRGAAELVCAFRGRDTFHCLTQEANLGVIALNSRRPDLALPVLRQAVEGFRAKLGEDSGAEHYLRFQIASALLESGQAKEALAEAQGLDGAKLQAASPGIEWSTRVEALVASAMIESGQRDVGLERLRVAYARLETEGLQEWILQPFRDRLEQAGAAPPIDETSALP